MKRTSKKYLLDSATALNNDKHTIDVLNNLGWRINDFGIFRPTTPLIEGLENTSFENISLDDDFLFISDNDSQFISDHDSPNRKRAQQNIPFKYYLDSDTPALRKLISDIMSGVYGEGLNDIQTNMEYNSYIRTYKEQLHQMNNAKRFVLV